MQTHLAPEYAGTPEGEAAQAILRKCVHCGFCTATCPTYQLLGDELDGPRGRIYLIKQVLEGAEPTRKTQQHLDRCLTCRNCESTCPSGVQYGQLVEIGRSVVDAKVERPAAERQVRWLLREGMTSAAFGPALKLGQLVRPLLPAALKNKVPPRPSVEQRAHALRWPTRSHPRRVLMLMGCVQPALAPNINTATARVLDACGIQTLVSDEAGCCGAIRAHLGDHDGAHADMRRNIDAWWPLIEGIGDNKPVEAIVFNASGCGVTVKEYGHALRDDPAYADKAVRVSAVARDLSELLEDLLPTLKSQLGTRPPGTGPRARLAFHPPCTLQHGQQLRGGVEAAFTELGYEVQLATVDPHLCCGSAGTYSVLQPDLAYQLRDRKVESLDARAPMAIISANVGCIQHLQTGTQTPVRHWVEVLDEALAR
ncbi:MAG: glycolate oxidase subunit GlcF [Leptothrix sp. (in: b-proteobacteria)]